MSKIRIFLADDHEVVRRGVRTLLEVRSEWEICGEASTGREAVEKVKKLKPDLVVLDISMPDMEGLQAVGEIFKAHSQAEVLVLTVHDSGETATKVLAAGARGLVLKADAARDLVRAIEALSQHKPFLSPRVTELIVRGYARSSEARHGARDLTGREKEITKFLGEGRSNKEIAASLCISPKTVDAHRTNIMRKLNLHSISDLIHFAIRNKIVEI